MRALLALIALAACTATVPPPEPAPAPTVEVVAAPSSTATPVLAAPAAAPGALPDPATLPDSPAGLVNGDYAPELALTDLLHGGSYRLSDHVGPTASGSAATIVAFAASWCGRCRLSYPYLVQMKEQFGDDLHLVFVTIDEGEPLMKKEADLIRAAGLDVPVLEPDADTLRAWLGRKRNIPHFYIINRAGEVLVQDRGFGEKVKKVLPGQIRYAMHHPDYIDRGRRP